MTYDGFHVRHFSLVSDEGLSILAIVLEIVETVSRWPSQLGVVTTPMLAKPSGGHRLIGKMTGLYRLWAKARRPHAVAWEEANDRPYFAAAAGSGPVDAIFRQSMRQEAAGANGEVAITVMEDMEAFYESICRDGLITEAAILNFPTCIARASMAAYAAPRMIAMGQYVARETYAKRGIIAGCAFATTYAKISYIRRFDQMVKEVPPGTKLDVYIDDVATTTVGPRRRAVADAIRAHDVLRRVLTRDLGCKLAPHKASVVASDRAAGKLVAAAIGREGAEVGCAVNLGVDVTAGGSRRRIGRSSKKSARERIGIKRGRRLWSVSKVLGRKALRIFTTGVAPAMCHGAQIWGLADAEVQSCRRVASQAMRPRSRCRSLTAVNLIHGMPTSMWETAVVVEYARAVWRANTQREYAADRGVALSDLRSQWESAHAKIEGALKDYRQSISQGTGRANPAVARRAWAEVRGPVGATALTLARIGWRMDSAFVLANNHGDEISLTTTSPALVRHLLREATLDAAERFIASQWASRDPTFGNRRVCPDVAIKLIKSACGGRLNAIQLGAYRAAVCNGIFTRQRAAENGYIVDNVCTHCGAVGDTIHHRTFCCPHTKAAVLEQIPRWLYEEGGRASPTDLFWSTSIFPHPADGWPRPAADFDGIIVGDEDGASGAEQWYDPTTGFGGWVYTDGSCVHSPIRGLARAAAAAVQVNDSGDRIRAIYLPVPKHLPQTSQAGEYVGVATARRMAVRRAHVHCDCENVVRTANAPAKAALSAAKTYAGIALDKYTRMGDAAVAGTEVSWVKAHRAAHDGMSEVERRDVKGNAAADKLAGEAVLLHPQPTYDQKQQLEFYLRRAPLVARAVGTALAMFPPAEAHRLRRRQPPASVEEAEATDRHYWQYGQGMWRCDRCGTWAHGDELRTKHYTERCPGHVAHRRAGAWTNKGHKVAMVSGVAPFAFCARCGAWGNRRARKLDRQCQGPTPAGTMALARIAKGKHPWRRRLSGGGDAARTNVVVTSAFDRSTKKWSSLDSTKRAVGRRRARHEAQDDQGEEGDVQQQRQRKHGPRQRPDDATGGAVGGSSGSGDWDLEGVADMDTELCQGAGPGAGDGYDEDPFGHGGSLSQEASSGCAGSDGKVSVGTRCAAGRGDGRSHGQSRGAGGEGQGSAAVSAAAGNDARVAGKVSRSATDRLEDVRRRVRMKVMSAAADYGTPGEVVAGRQLKGVGEPHVGAGLPTAQTRSVDNSLEPFGVCGGGETGGARRQTHHPPRACSSAGVGGHGFAAMSPPGSC
jgi:hypothetical protein